MCKHLKAGRKSVVIKFYNINRFKTIEHVLFDYTFIGHKYWKAFVYFKGVRLNGYLVKMMSLPQKPIEYYIVYGCSL